MKKFIHADSSSITSVCGKKSSVQIIFPINIEFEWSSQNATINITNSCSEKLDDRSTNQTNI